MIRLIHRDGMEILLNSSLIRSVGIVGLNTVILLKNGEHVLVKSPPSDITTKIEAHHFGLDEERRAHEDDFIKLLEKKEQDKEDKLQRHGRRPRPEPPPPAAPVVAVEPIEPQEPIEPIEPPD